MAVCFRIENHHNALCDAITCAKLVIATINEIRRGNISQTSESANQIRFYRFSDLKVLKSIKKGKFNKFSKTAISEIAATTNDFDVSHTFYGKNIVFTGELVSMERKDAMQTVVDLGGILKSSVSSKTDYLVVGIQDKSIVGEDGMSTKEEKAHLLNNSGCNIKIINESQFLNLIKK